VLIQYRFSDSPTGCSCHSVP